MLRPRLRKTGKKHYKVNKCPVCGAAILHESVTTKSGDFCRKCGHFFEVKPDKQQLGGWQQENIE